MNSLAACAVRAGLMFDPNQPARKKRETMDLMQGEKMLLESDNGELVLTSHRVRYENNRMAYGRITSIMLDSLTSCEIAYVNQPLWLFLAAIIALLTLSQMNDINGSSFMGGMLIAAFFVGVYSLTRRQALSLASPSASIKVNISGMSTETAKRFIDTAEKAKADWLKS